jgi:hypothetical protein
MGFHYSRIKQILYKKFKNEPWFSEVLSYTTMRYHSIESRLIETFRYVDCNPLNYKVFSHEYTSILRDSGSVFSSIMDRLVKETSCQQIKKEYNIRHYRKWLINNVEQIDAVVVTIYYPFNQRIAPFHENEDGKLGWWIAYNNVKHSDIDKFKDGNLENALLSLGALAVLYTVMDAHNGSQIRLFDKIGFVNRLQSLRELK